MLFGYRKLLSLRLLTEFEVTKCDLAQFFPPISSMVRATPLFISVPLMLAGAKCMIRTWQVSSLYMEPELNGFVFCSVGLREAPGPVGPSLRASLCHSAEVV